MAGKADFGASSPEKPALVIPDPLSMTIPYDSDPDPSSSSDDMFILLSN